MGGFVSGIDILCAGSFQFNNLSWGRKQIYLQIEVEEVDKLGRVPVTVVPFIS